MLRAASLRLLSVLLGMALLPLTQPVFAMATPPSNDDFANATQVSALPFTDTVDTTTATLEPGEPPAPFCALGVPGSVWYRFTPETSGSILVRALSFDVQAEAMIYRGTSLGALTSVDCASNNNPLAVGVVAGSTYYFQVGPLFGPGGPITFSLSVAPPLQVAFGFNPSDPSIFDEVNFGDQTFVEGFGRIESCTWDFGGGDTDTGCVAFRKFATDGDRSVTHTATSHDGRTGSVTQVVHVQTHDIGIVGFSVPRTARVGSTQRITVEVNNTRYPENVRVRLQKSLPSTVFIDVAELTQPVPVRAATRTTKFSFDYTFVADDAVLGKVVFEASADIVGARDALPIDNGVVGPSTVVQPART